MKKIKKTIEDQVSDLIFRNGKTPKRLEKNHKKILRYITFIIASIEGCDSAVEIVKEGLAASHGVKK